MEFDSLTTSESSMTMISSILLVILCLAYATQGSMLKPEIHNVITSDQETNVPTYDLEKFQEFLTRHTPPYYFSVTVGDARNGKSETGNLRIRIRTEPPLPGSTSFFTVCDALEPCTKGIDVVAVPRAQGVGTDFYFDVEGSSLTEKAEDMSVFLTMGACISSGPLVLVDSNLDDNTLVVVGRIAGHLLDQRSAHKVVGCSFHEGGPALAILVNKNDAAERQEARPGGLRGLWDRLATARPKEATVINQVFSSIQLFALGHERDLSQLRSLDSEFGKKVRTMDALLMEATTAVTLVSESNNAKRIPGTAATIAHAVGDIFDQAKSLAKDGFHVAPRLHDFVVRDASRASTVCLEKFNTAAALWEIPTCDTRCSGEGHSCQVVHEWLAPARAAAEECFVDATTKWREGGNPFGASVLDPALKQLNADTLHRADELHNAWQQANSVDPARTQHESNTREISRRGPSQCSKRYGGRCYAAFGPSKYADFCTYATFLAETRSCTFKRCGAALGCTEWKETSRVEKEVAKERQNMC